MKQRVAVIDYGMGNLYSVCNSFGAVGIKTEIISTPKSIFKFDKLILPGVGAFGDAMEELSARGLKNAIKEFVLLGKPLLGICLGMHLLLDKSEESKGVEGLGIISGEVKKFSSKLKCPHIGWNEIEKSKRTSQLFRGLNKDIYAYFCHSYFVKPLQKSVVLAETEYGIRFASMIGRGNIYGLQFHPEKSQAIGLTMLKNFIQLC
jgi:glutamine amidotransferase